MSVTHVPPVWERAIAHYGPQINHIARKRYGISGQELLARLTAGESHFDMGAVSSAGARGGTQFMPATRAEYIRRFHVDPWKDPDSAIHGTTIYLKRNKGDLGTYNPGDPSYPGYILGQHVAGLGKSQRGAGGGGGGGAGGGGGQQASLSARGALPDYDASGSIKALQALLGQQGAPAVVQASPPPMPSFSAQPVSVDGGYEPPPSGQSTASGGSSSVEDVLSQLAGVLGPSLATDAPKLSSTAVGGTAGRGGGGGAQQFGKVHVSAGANRAGVGLKPITRHFLSVIAGVAGHPLTVGTGTNHNRLTTTGNVSDHWDGHGADIPARGAALTRLGQQALIAAGMDPKKARQQTGGAFTLYWRGHRVQIIFNSNVGGDHYDHLHAGIR